MCILLNDVPTLPSSALPSPALPILLAQAENHSYGGFFLDDVGDAKPPAHATTLPPLPSDSAGSNRSDLRPEETFPQPRDAKIEPRELLRQPTSDEAAQQADLLEANGSALGQVPVEGLMPRVQGLQADAETDVPSPSDGLQTPSTTRETNPSFFPATMDWTPAYYLAPLILFPLLAWGIWRGLKKRQEATLRRSRISARGKRQLGIREMEEPADQEIEIVEGSLRSREETELNERLQESYTLIDRLQNNHSDLQIQNEQLSERNAELIRLNEDMETQLADQNSDQTDQQTHLQTLTNRLLQAGKMQKRAALLLTQRGEKIESLSMEITDQSAHSVDLERQLAGLSDQNTELIQQQRSLQENCESLQQDLHNETVDLRSVRDELNSACEEIANSKREREQERAHFESIAKEKATQQAAEQQSLLQVREQLMQDVHALRGESEEALAKCTESGRQTEQLKLSLAESRSEVETLALREREFKKQLTDTQNAAERMQSESTSETERLQKGLSQAESTIKGLETDVHTLHQEQAEAQASFEKSSQVADLLQAKLAGITDEKSQLHSQWIDSKDRASKLQDERDRTTTTIRELHDREDAMQQRVASLERQMDQGRETLAETEKLTRELRSGLRSAREETDQARQALETATTGTTRLAQERDDAIGSVGGVRLQLEASEQESGQFEAALRLARQQTSKLSEQHQALLKDNHKLLKQHQELGSSFALLDAELTDAKEKLVRSETKSNSPKKPKKEKKRKQKKEKKRKRK